MTIKYAGSVGQYTLHRRDARPHGQNQMGYGRKITTSIMLRFVMGERRMYRVYCCCFSNSGSNYIIRKGECLYLKTHFQSEVQE